VIGERLVAHYEAFEEGNWTHSRGPALLQLVVPPWSRSSLFKIAQTPGDSGRKTAVGGATSKAMTTLAELNRLWPADHNATPWVATSDGSWTRRPAAASTRTSRRPATRPNRGAGTCQRVQLTPEYTPTTGRRCARSGRWRVFRAGAAVTCTDLGVGIAFRNSSKSLREKKSCLNCSSQAPLY
jgi:hypothetical protein